jgi:ATP-dependent DNA helicase RecQ
MNVAPQSTLLPQPEAKRTAPTASAIQAFGFFRKGLSVEQVAEKLQRALSTTHGYLIQYIQREKITDPSPWIDADTASQIRHAAEQVGTERLKPIFEQLGQQISYDLIRIVVTCVNNRI